MAIQKLVVSSVQEMESTVLSYLNQGFIVANKTPTSTTLQKRKEFSVVWAVVGFLLCIVPLLIYLIVYATKPAVEIVEVVVM
jgi:hypothetical protein